MYELKLENLKGFCEIFTEDDEKFIEYHVYDEYEIIIDGKVLSHIYQENKDIDRVEVFSTDGNESLPMRWNYEVNVLINKMIRTEMPIETVLKIIRDYDNNKNNV
jgi:hypothetical protein